VAVHEYRVSVHAEDKIHENNVRKNELFWARLLLKNIQMRRERRRRDLVNLKIIVQKQKMSKND